MYEDTHTVRTGKRRRTNWFFPFFDWPPMCGIKIKERQMSARNPYKFINSNFCVSHSSFCDISSITLVSTGGNSSRRIPTFVYRDRLLYTALVESYIGIVVYLSCFYIRFLNIWYLSKYYMAKFEKHIYILTRCCYQVIMQLISKFLSCNNQILV